MPSLFGSNPSSSDPANDTVPSPSSSCSSSSLDMWNYFFVPILLCLTKELSLGKAQTSTGLLLPSQRGDGSADDSLISFSSCANADPKLYYRPVIGILSHPGDGASGRLNNDTNASYIAASYVKFVEAAGARIIPLIYNEPEEILFQKLELVNGVLFTGGWSKYGLYYDIAKKIFKKVIEKNDRGDHFPLYAICLGFELLTMIISEDKNILEPFSASNQASSLQFVENVNIEGTVFQRFPPNLLQKLGTDCLVMQNHRYGISPEKLQNTPNLSRFFKILTTSTDKNNKVYVSTAQAHGYPVTAFQWHPEKNAFEWGLPMIPHSDDAIEVTQHVANFLIREARRSLNRPAAQKVLDNLIYNYSPTFCGKAGRGFDEVYIFTQRQARI
ncbi:Gamma-glutamyl hydrolase -like protein [Gossypium arboreum]|uniref:folate gamma-glutamyl hydrolase n=1 Tax=Gossypium arboreum TaxID=29729 RepID=A0A0B0N0K6_GOSAR|nr:gamma-glutamyl hydrolase 2-like [Gossypium arboreum]KHG06555.1 Gamma-glutamyl hydrolase -like protein [Gossypium arboreum]